jgi:hypothetical protein
MLLPHCVLNSKAYMTLSGDGVRLLIDIAMQYNTHNNGQLLASWKYMNEKRGWTSSDTLNKAKKELVEHELICLTVQGRLPNKASWYGLTWLALDNIKGLEIATQSWPRGIYARWVPSPNLRKKRKPPIKKITSSCP